jgi:tRNASer (uridine44-2'-O)-methyltransferase
MNVWINRPNVINKRIHCAIVRSASTDSTNTCTILNRQLIPKSDHYKPGNDTIHIDGSNQCVTFTPSIPHADYASYQFKYITDTSISLLLQVGECSVPLEEGVAIHPTKEWLRYSLLPKICKWAEGEEQDGATPTSSLVPSERFCLLYKELKQKYGPTLVKNWTETTDPYKFVYEDIAIATYLLILWEEERGRHGLECKQSFVDLGCGNGLLVFILSCEGVNIISIVTATYQDSIEAKVLI